MPFDQRLHTAAKIFPSFLGASPLDADDAVVEFEDRLWAAAEAAMAAGAPSISFVAEAASLVRRQSDLFASTLSGAIYMKSLGEDAGPVCGQALGGDIASVGDHLIRRLEQELASLGG